MTPHAHAAELAKAMQTLFDNCVMVHKHWGEGSNSKEADAAQAAARAALAKWEKHESLTAGFSAVRDPDTGELL